LNKIIQAYPVERHGVSDFLLDIVSGYRPAFSIHQRFKSDASSDLAAARAN